MSQALDSQDDVIPLKSTSQGCNDDIQVEASTDIQDDDRKEDEMQSGEDPTVPKWVSIHSKEYKKFITKIEMNWESNSTKLSVCLVCWGFLSFSLKKKHMEHSHYTLTPSFVKNEEMFLKLAKKHKRMSEDEQNVQIFAEKCKVVNFGAPLYGSKKDKSGSSNHNLYELCRIESENIIKRMSIMVNKLYEESNSKDNRIHELETQLDQVRAQLVDIERQFNYVASLKPETVQDEKNEDAEFQQHQVE